MGSHSMEMCCVRNNKVCVCCRWRSSKRSSRSITWANTVVASCSGSRPWATVYSRPTFPRWVHAGYPVIFQLTRVNYWGLLKPVLRTFWSVSNVILQLFWYRKGRYNFLKLCCLDQYGPSCRCRQANVTALGNVGGNVHSCDIDLFTSTQRN